MEHPDWSVDESLSTSSKLLSRLILLPFERFLTYGYGNFCWSSLQVPRGIVLHEMHVDSLSLHFEWRSVAMCERGSISASLSRPVTTASAHEDPQVQKQVALLLAVLMSRPKLACCFVAIRFWQANIKLVCESYRVPAAEYWRIRGRIPHFLWFRSYGLPLDASWKSLKMNCP